MSVFLLLTLPSFFSLPVSLVRFERAQLIILHGAFFFTKCIYVSKVLGFGIAILTLNSTWQYLKDFSVSVIAVTAKNPASFSWKKIHGTQPTLWEFIWTEKQNHKRRIKQNKLLRFLVDKCFSFLKRFLYTDSSFNENSPERIHNCKTSSSLQGWLWWFHLSWSPGWMRADVRMYHAGSITLFSPLPSYMSSLLFFSSSFSHLWLSAI